MKSKQTKTNLAISQEFTEALREVNSYLTNLNLKYCLIGGLAVQLQGEQRFTNAIDLTVAISIADEMLEEIDPNDSRLGHWRERRAG